MVSSIKLHNKKLNVIDMYELEKEVNKLLKCVKKTSRSSAKTGKSSIAFDRYLKIFLSAGFFKPLLQKVFAGFPKKIINKKGKTNIFGLLLSMVLNDKPMIRKYLFQIITFKVKMENIEGMYGIITKDITMKNEIKTLLKKINLDSTMALNLIRFVSPKSEYDLYNSTYQMCKDYCQNASSISTFLCLFKSKVYNVKVVCESMGIDMKLMSLLLACATNNLQSLDIQKYKLLSDKLRINNQYACEAICNIAGGNEKSMLRILSNDNNSFDNDKVGIIEAIYCITKESVTNVMNKVPLESEKLIEYINTIVESLPKNHSIGSQKQYCELFIIIFSDEEKENCQR